MRRAEGLVSPLIGLPSLGEEGLMEVDEEEGRGLIGRGWTKEEGLGDGNEGRNEWPWDAVGTACLRVQEDQHQECTLDYMTCRWDLGRGGHYGLPGDVVGLGEDAMRIQGCWSWGRVPPRPMEPDEDHLDPRYIPKRGYFYQHDDRAVTESNRRLPPKKEERRKWFHDKFHKNDQGTEKKVKNKLEKAQRRGKYRRRPIKDIGKRKYESVMTRGNKEPIGPTTDIPPLIALFPHPQRPIQSPDCLQ
jgi:hypothetical protein